MPLPPQLRWKLDRWKSRVGGILRGEERPKRPRLCPLCGQLVGAEQNRCAACGTSMTFSLAAASRGLAGLVPQPHPVTKIVTGLNFFLFLVCMAATYSATEHLSMMGSISNQVLYRMGARNTLALLLGHQWWRLVVPIFLHANLLHIGLNTWVLVDIGPAVEELYGSARYLFFYVVSGVLGYVFSTGWDVVRGVPGESIGASGAIMGLIGLQLAVSSQRGGPYFQMIRTQLIKWVVIIFAIGFFWGGIDNAAHLGGLVAGYLLGRMAADREPADMVERRRANLLALAALVVVVGSFAAMILHYSKSIT
ncbi:MAG TPA: rhomboid family intramembrane serine protease [Candidatus Acidoferrales bacterium]|nr:rhomboid family intramembrane serine protease [Candidatus Acidoferrales bacterium]